MSRAASKPEGLSLFPFVAVMKPCEIHRKGMINCAGAARRAFGKLPVSNGTAVTHPSAKNRFERAAGTIRMVNCQVNVPAVNPFA